MSGLVAIHQPNFFPWLGYFDKIRRSDVFIFLDSVNYPRSGSGGMGSWTNRVRLSIKGEASWVTCPLRRLALGQPILDAEIDDQKPWRTKLRKTLQANYGKSAKFVAAMALLEPLIQCPEINLSAFNIAAIKGISTHLAISTTFMRQSELPHTGHATELLISLVKAAGGTAYLAGGGAAGYQEDEMFKAQGVQLVYQNFKPCTYGPPDRFQPGLSVIDYLMHDGRPLVDAFPDGGYDQG